MRRDRARSRNSHVYCNGNGELVEVKRGELTPSLLFQPVDGHTEIQVICEESEPEVRAIRASSAW